MSEGSFKEITIDIGHGMHMAAKVYPPALHSAAGEHAEPVVAFHGWLDNASTFDLIAPALQRAGRQLISIDLVGHGLSSHRPAGCTYHTIDHVADMAAAIDALGLATFAVMGHSLGAALGAALAAMWPERVTRVMMLESIGAWATEESKMVDALRKSVAQRPHRPPRVHASLEAAAVANSKGFLRTPLEACRVLVARGTRQVEGGYVWRADPRLLDRSRLPFTASVCKAYASAVTQPVLLVLASDGIYSRRPAEPVRERKACFRQLTDVVVEGGGHHFHLTKPDIVAKHVLAFLAADSTAEGEGSG